MSATENSHANHSNPHAEPSTPKADAHLQEHLFAWMTLSSLQREPLDAAEVRAILQDMDASADSTDRVNELALQLRLPAPRWLKAPDAGLLPLLVISPEGQWGVVTDLKPDGAWTLRQWDDATRQGIEIPCHAFASGHRFVKCRLTAPLDLSTSPMVRQLLGELTAQKTLLTEVGAATLSIGLLTLATSFYSMQVYNRVVPTHGVSTLITLTVGVMIAILFETALKWVRSSQLHHIAECVDRNMTRRIYARFLNIRLDQLPLSVGATASRLRGHESIRAFMISLCANTLIDAPLAVISLAVLAYIGGSLAVIPGICLVLGVAVGLMTARRSHALAAQAAPARHLKTGLLVESIEGAETIKSGQGGWRMLSRWLQLSDEAQYHDRQMAELSERTQFIAGLLHQLAYISLVALGALQIGVTDLTMGALIACSILSGRILTPISQLPTLMLQWANTRIAIQDLDRVWALKSDHPEGVQPVIPSRIHGHYELQDVRMSYNSQLAIHIPKLSIQAGERVGILGVIGGGKTSLLRILSGMYKPQDGRVLLDSVDLDLIQKQSLADAVGYVPQEGRLFSGTLRENLILGLPDPGDSAILEAAQRTGLLDTVVRQSPKGLDRDILEGGAGLSGGQRQLVHITRALLRKPRIWLLDEPTAHMDQGQEARILHLLQEELSQRPDSTLILVTHKPATLHLVNRLIVIAGHQIALDGPRDAVLQHLAQMAAGQNATQGATP